MGFPPDSSDIPSAHAPDQRLDSWKEIAAYLKRDATTVRRWEKREGLPVHRHQHEQRGSVYAYKRELDDWWLGRGSQLGDNGTGNGATSDTESGLTESAFASDTPAHSWPPQFLKWSAVAAIFAAALVVSWRAGARSQANNVHDRPELQFSLFPPEKTSLRSVSLSPDGRLLVFAASGDGTDRLWIRPLDSTVAQPLPDTEGAMFPFWSPASDAIGFFAAERLWIVDASGGRPRPVCDARDGRGGTWNEDGVIVFAPDGESGLYRVHAAGGPATSVTTLDDPNERGHLWPEFLPGGRHFLYLADSRAADGEHYLFAGTLDGKAPRRLFQLASAVVFTRSGHLVFERERQLLAQPFDTSRLALTGKPITIVDRVHSETGAQHRADFSVSDNGILAYRSRQSSEARLVWRDRTAVRAALVGTPADYTEPTLSPDETQVAIDRFDLQPSHRFGYGVNGIRGDIWMLDRATGRATQFTSDPAAEWGPVWAPDGHSLVFSSNKHGPLELFQKNVSGEPQDESGIATTGTNPVAQFWSPDGKYVVYAATDPRTHTDLWLLPMTGDRTPVPLLRTEFSEAQAQISPDGRWFAYVSNESGREEVYVQSFPKPTTRWRVSNTGGGDPRWRRDGRELFYIGADRRLMSVAVKTDTTFNHGVAVPLFDTGLPPHWYAARNLYDVSRDGSFLFMTPVEDDRTSPFTIVINWTNSLPK